MISLAAAMLLFLACTTEAADTIVMEIGTCTQLKNAAAATATGPILGELTSDSISCRNWTDMEVTNNRLTLVPGVSYSGEVYSSFVIKKARFLVYSELRVEPDVELLGTGFQEAEGGFLKVAEGGDARFSGEVYMHDINNGLRTSDEMMAGGCIHNEGYLKFMDTFTATNCNNGAQEGYLPGDGSGLWNGEEGTVVFTEYVSMTNCGTLLENDDLADGNDGGAIWNNGRIVFQQDASFEDNAGDDGGVIYNSIDGSITFRKAAGMHFLRNSAYHNGGHVYNEGSITFRSVGSFKEGNSGGSGGAVYNQGDASTQYRKAVEFSSNSAGGHGGAIYTSYTAVGDLPEDATFSDNLIRNADQDYYCPDIYVLGELEDDYECLP